MGSGVTVVVGSTLGTHRGVRLVVETLAVSESLEAGQAVRGRAAVVLGQGRRRSRLVAGRRQQAGAARVVVGRGVRRGHCGLGRHSVTGRTHH